MKSLPTGEITKLEDHGDELQALSLKQRGELIVSACRSAAQIEQSRRASGLPPSQLAPWPESTWAFLRKHAPGIAQWDALNDEIPPEV